MVSVSQHLLDKNTDGNAILSVGFPTLYAILIDILGGNTVEYVTQWSVGSSTHISHMSKIRRHAIDGKKKVYVSKRR